MRASARVSRPPEGGPARPRGASARAALAARGAAALRAGRVDAGAIVALQRSAGNRSVSQLVQRRAGHEPERVLQRTLGHPAQDFRPCSTAAEKPDLAAWFADSVLEKVREDPVGANTQLLAGPSSKPEVREATRLVQQALRAWGCAVLGVDALDGARPNGEFGPRTTAAIKAFQAGPRPPDDLGIYLATDGIVGPLTMKELDRFVAERTDAPSPAPPTPKPKPPTGKPLTKDEAAVIVYGLIGLRPTSMSAKQLQDILMQIGTIAQTAYSALSGGTSLNPLPVWVLAGVLDGMERAFFEADALQGVAYGMVDFAVGRRRTRNELLGVFPAARTEGFVKGYRRIQSRLLSARTRGTPGLAEAMNAFADHPDKAQLLKYIYNALWDVYWNRGAVKDHAAIRDARRWCHFAYPKLEASCGPNRT